MATEHVAQVLSRASGLWKLGRRVEALTEIEAALAWQAENPSLILQHGAFLRELGRPREALAALEGLRCQAPEDAGLLLELARAHRALGEHASALASLEVLLRADPSRHAALTLRIDTLVSLDRPGEALAAADAALAALPGDRALAQRRARLLMGLGRAAEAVVVLRPLHRRRPDNSTLALELALALDAAGDQAASTAMLDALLAVHPLFVPAWKVRIDAAAERADHAVLAELARGLFGRVAAEGCGNAAVLLAQILPQLDLKSWGAEAAAWISAICPHAGRIKHARLWALHGMALLLGQPESCRQLLAALLAAPGLRLNVALGVLRWARTVSPEHEEQIAPQLRRQLPEEARRLFDLEHMALEQGPALALRRRPRERHRSVAEVMQLLSLLKRARLMPLGLRYAALARRFHPADPELRRCWLSLLEAAGEAERARIEAEAMLAPSARASVKDQRVAIDTLIALGHCARALEVLDALESPANRAAFRKLRLELMLRFGRIDAARALVSEATTFGNARRAMHFGISMEGQQLTELGIAEASRTAGGRPLEGQLVGPSVLALDAHLARLPPPAGQGPGRIPRRIMQYWNTGDPPPGLDEIMASWRGAEGFDYQLFDRRSALRFLTENFGAEWATALRLAHHAAEESDFFRLAFLAARGGIYADCDDKLIGPAEGLTEGACGLVVYRERKGTIANNLILAEAAHPVVIRAAVAAKQALLRKDNDSTWAKTGPGLLTRVVAVALGEEGRGMGEAGVMVRRMQDAAPHVRCHIALPYKKTAQYWNASRSGLHMATTPPPLP